MADINKIQDALGDIAVGKILYDEPMSRYASLLVGGKADALVFIVNEDQLIQIVRRLKEKKIDFLPVGNMTNIIVRDGGYHGVILLMKGLNGVSYLCTPERQHYISAQAGAALASVLSRALAEELTGMEFCAGIPGSIGGAVRMNAGAYGREIKDVVEIVFLLDVDGKKKALRREEISFSYRKAGLPPEAIILSARFRLEKGQAQQIKKRTSEIIQWRHEKHPLEYPNAGSVFKNIPGQTVGELIEELGMKGVSCGDAQVSLKHANFIVNRGKAKASDVLELIALIQSKAKQEKGVILEPEVVIIGED
ncbi:MAG: UDP-N-acetylmuramate dehydrogenase [Smithellaceae bacterium]|jgi:UDP-N-acetylmuramate dehydrogenase